MNLPEYEEKEKCIHCGSPVEKENRCRYCHVAVCPDCLYRKHVKSKEHRSAFKAYSALQHGLTPELWESIKHEDWKEVSFELCARIRELEKEIQKLKEEDQCLRQDIVAIQRRLHMVE